MKSLRVQTTVALACLMLVGSIVSADDLEDRVSDLEQRQAVEEAMAAGDAARACGQHCTPVSDDVAELQYQEWLKTNDPFASGPNAE